MAYYSLPKTKPPESQVPTRVENNRARRSQQLVQEEATLQQRGLQIQQDQAERQRQQQLGGLLQGMIDNGLFRQPDPMAPMLAPLMGGLPGLGAPQQRPMGGLPGFDDGGYVDTEEEERPQAEEREWPGWAGWTAMPPPPPPNFNPGVQLDPSQIDDRRGQGFVLGRDDYPLRSNDTLRALLNYERGYHMPGYARGGSVRTGLPGFADGGDVFTGGGWEFGETEEEKYERFLAEQEALKAVVPAPTPAEIYTQQAQQVFAQNPELVQVRAGEMQANNADANLAQIRSMREEADKYKGPEPQQTQIGRENIQAPLDTLRGQQLHPNQLPNETVPTLPQGYREDPKETIAKILAGPAQVYEGLNIDIPYVSPAVRAVSPYIEEVASRILPGPELLASQLGLPSPGRTAVQNTLGSGGALDLGLLLAPGVGELPIDDLIRGGAAATRLGGREAAVRLGSSSAFDRFAPQSLLADERRGANFLEGMGGNRVQGARVGQQFGPEIGGGTGGEWFSRPNRGDLPEVTPPAAGSLEELLQSVRESRTQASLDELVQSVLASRTQAGAEDILRQSAPPPNAGLLPQSTPSGITPPGPGFEQGMLSREPLPPPQQTWLPGPQGGFEGAQRLMEGLPPPATTMPTPPPGALPGQFGLPTPPPGAVPSLQPSFGQPPQGGLPGIGNLPFQSPPGPGQGLFPGMPPPAAMPTPPPGALPGQPGLPTPPGPQIGLPAPGGTGMAGGRQVLNPVEGGNAARISDLMRQAQAGAPPPAALPVPPRAEAPPAPPAPPPAQLPSQRLPAETLAKRVAGPVPAANDVSRLSFMEKQEQARMLGVDLDEGALIKGTPLAKSLENAKLQKATDEFLAPPGSNPADQLHQKLQEQAASQAAAGGAPPVGALPPPPPVSVIPPGTEPPGGWPKGIDTPEKQSAARLIADALYSSLGMDIGTIMRQDVLNMFNLANVPQSMKVIEYAGRMFTSRNEAIKVLDELDALKLATDKAVGKNVKIALPDIPGIREAKGYTNVESNQSTLMGKIPGVGAVYNATGRANNGIIYARRILQYAEFVDNLPNRRFVIGLGEKANTPAAKGAVAQAYMRQQQVLSGRANLGSGALQDVLSKTGPLFTSLRFMMSVPERIPYLLPVNRIAQGHWEIMGPQWREAVKAHAGFAATLAGTLYAADKAGLELPKDENGYPDGRIKFAGNTYDLTGGLRGYWSTIQKMAAGDPMAGVDFLRNKVGPIPQVAVQILQETGAGRALGIESYLDYMRAEGFYNKGFLGTGTAADRIAAYIAPLWMSEVAQSWRNAEVRGDNPLLSAAAAVPGAFFGTGARSSAPSPLSERRADIKGDPSLPEEIRDAEYKDLGPDGKAAQDKAAEAKDPEGFKEDQAKQRENEDPAFTKNREVKEQINAEEVQRKDALLEAMRSGRLSGGDVREARTIIESAANARRDAARNDPALKKATDAIEKNDVSKALDVFYAIQDQYKKPDGKTDYPAAQAKQAEFLLHMEKTDPETAKYLMYEVNTHKAPTNALDEIYAVAQPTISRYFGEIKEPTARENLRRGNPADDALLNLLGYANKTLTPEAGTILKSMRETLPAPGAAAPVAAGGTRGNSAPAPAAAAAPPPAPAAGNFVFPVQGYSGKVNTHWDTGEKGGTDLFAARGTPVLAMDGGKVISVGTTGLGGNNVTIRGNDGRDYYYAHGDRAPAVKVGETIPTGHFLFGVGDSGNAQGKGTHLHLGIGYGINNGSGPQGGSGKDFDAISHLNAALGGGGGGGGMRGMSAPIPAPAAAPANTTDLRAYGSSAAQRNGIDPAMFQKLIMHESSWNPDAVNKTSGAAGLGQMLPSTARGYGVTTEQLRQDPNLALDLSARMLGEARQYYKGDQQKAVASYFVGMGNVDKAVRAGGPNWLEELDRIAAQYKQGSVTSYLRAVGAR